MKKITLALIYLTGICLIVGSASAPPPRHPKGQARFILIEGNKGIIALPRRELDRKQALYLIRKKCPMGGTIVKEAEEVVGTIESEYDAQQKTSIKQKGQKKVIKQNKTEYRIYYECR
jgi:hypothetical protein